MSQRIWNHPVSPQETIPKPATGRLRLLALRSIALLAMLLALYSTHALGQINTATVFGTVKDGTGAVVPDASVAVVQTATGITRTAQTNDAGLFTVPLLQPGVYAVTISKAGFQNATEPNVELQVNQLASLNFTLTVGSVKQTVTVTEAVPLLETETAGLGTVIATKEINDLPLNGRQFIQLLQLAPGTVPVSVSQTAVPALGGGGVKYHACSQWADRAQQSVLRRWPLRYRPVLRFSLDESVGRCDAGVSGTDPHRSGAIRRVHRRDS